MLRVTMQLIPYGDESKARTIGTMEIANVGGDLQIGDYEVKITEDSPRGPRQVRGEVRQFHRSLGAWSLVARALQTWWMR